MARKVKVATVALRGRAVGTVEGNRAHAMELLELAVSQETDIVCLPETFLNQGVDFEHVREIAEDVPGPTTEAAAKYAKAGGCYVICPLIARHGDAFMNDAVLIDRQGEIVGAYSKLHPVVQGWEYKQMENGVTPGSDAPIFETDFGTIGMQICFDTGFPDGWATLAENGAEIVFWPSAYDGGKHLGIHAWNHRYYVVSAVQSTRARIIDIMGEVLAMTGRCSPVIAHTINLDVALFHCDFNRAAVPDIQRKYGPDVTVKVWDEEGMFTLETERDDFSVADLIAEFNLETYADYHARNARLQGAWRKGEPIPDLTPPYVGREQWSG
jgi:predicted amidohydrolase